MKIIKDDVEICQSGSLLIIEKQGVPILNTIGLFYKGDNNKKKGIGVPIAEFYKCKNWIDFYVKKDKLLKSKNENAFSYGLKHRVEDWIADRNTNPYDNYISNGSFIAAALDAGITVYQCDINAFFNISNRDISRWITAYPKVPKEY